MSHGDIHTGNIVTLTALDKTTGQVSTKIDDFGVIDWGSIGIDNAYGDLQDFWLHHYREAEKICGVYDYSFNDIESAYTTQVFKSAREQDFALEMPPHSDVVIQSALWNLYEMYDPVRTDNCDIQQKARTHLIGLLTDLGTLCDLGYRKEARKIQNELHSMFAETVYLSSLLRN